MAEIAQFGAALEIAALGTSLEEAEFGPSSLVAGSPVDIINRIGKKVKIISKKQSIIKRR